MTLNDYIEKFKSVDMIGKTPLEAYKELLSIISLYYHNAQDDCLGDVYNELNDEIIKEDIWNILNDEGDWRAVWKYIHTIPEESINDMFFGVSDGHLRPINWDDVAETQKAVIETLQSKQSDPLETYIKKIKDIKMDSNNPRLALFNLSNLVYAYGADTYDSSLADYYISRFTSKEQAEDFISEIARSDGLEGVWKYVRLIPEDSIKDDVFCASGDYNEGYSLQPVTLDDVVELQKDLIKLLKQKKEEKKNEA